MAAAKFSAAPAIIRNLWKFVINTFDDKAGVPVILIYRPNRFLLCIKTKTRSRGLHLKKLIWSAVLLVTL